jgi:hypothetical protein
MATYNPHRSVHIRPCWTELATAAVCTRICTVEARSSCPLKIFCSNPHKSTVYSLRPVAEIFWLQSYSWQAVMFFCKNFLKTPDKFWQFVENVRRHIGDIRFFGLFQDLFRQTVGKPLLLFGTAQRLCKFAKMAHWSQIHSIIPVRDKLGQNLHICETHPTCNIWLVSTPTPPPPNQP